MPKYGKQLPGHKIEPTDIVDRSVYLFILEFTLLQNIAYHT